MGDDLKGLWCMVEEEIPGMRDKKNQIFFKFLNIYFFFKK
jgi:hypothetical protein